MADGLLQRLPEIGPLLERRTEAERQLEALLGTFASLDAAHPASPIVPVSSVVASLGIKLDIDTSGLSEGLPNTIDVIEKALPPSALEYVEAIEDGYSSARSFLRDSPLARKVAAGSTLQEAALAEIAQALTLFNQRLGQLAEGLIDPEALDGIRRVFTAIENFRSDFPGHRDEFLPFLTNHLLGVRPDVLRGPLEHLDASYYAVLAPLDEEALSQTVDPAREALAATFDDLVVALEGFDPAEATAYAELQLRLEELEPAIRATVAAVTPVYRQLQTLVENHAWDDTFSTYRNLLQAVTLERPFTVETVTDGMAEALEEFLSRFHMTFGVDDLTERLEALSSMIRDASATSALGQVRRTIRDFLDDVQDAIEAVPAEEIRQTVESMLERVGQELDSLGINRVKESISTALDEAQSFVVENIDSALTGRVRSALELVLADVQSLGLDTLLSELSAAIDQLDHLIGEIEQALKDRMDGVTNLVSRLDTLSFKPVSDQVIEQIDELRTRLEAIDPNTLSDAEKLAIRAALAVIEEIDLEDEIIKELKKQYDEAEGRIKLLLNELAAALERLREGLDAFKPERVLGPVGEGLELASNAVQRLNGRTLVDPLRKQVDGFIEKLRALSPGQLLDPLQGPYDSMMQTVNCLDPASWIAPLNDLYEQIDKLIDLVDVTPLLDELDRMQRELFDNVRASIIEALENLDLPEPLQGFFAGMRPVLEDTTDAVFSSPDVELPRIGGEVNSQLSLRRLSEPLDEAFDELLQMVESVPQDELTGVVNTMREGIGAGLDALDPNEIIRHLRAGHARLVALDPRVLLGLPLALPGLKVAFEVEAEAAPPERRDDVIAVSARFEAAISLVATGVDSSLIQPLIEAHDALAEALRRRINALDASGADEVYTDLREGLDHVLPPFLHSRDPLTHDEVMEGLHAMRPSIKFDRVEEVLERFLRQIQPLEDALQPAIDGFFGGIREVLMLVNPLDLKDAVEDVYDSIREKVRVLDPEALAGSIRENFFDPLTGALEDINPATIKEEIDQTYGETVTAVSTSVEKVLDDIEDVLEEKLGAMRQQIQSLLGQVQETITSAVGRVRSVADRLERLIFVELLERLRQVIENLGLSFDRELDRVRNAFDEMIAAIPLGTSGAASAGAAV